MPLHILPPPKKKQKKNMLLEKKHLSFITPKTHRVFTFEKDSFPPIIFLGKQRGQNTNQQTKKS